MALPRSDRLRLLLGRRPQDHGPARARSPRQERRALATTRPAMQRLRGQAMSRQRNRPCHAEGIGDVAAVHPPVLQRCCRESAAQQDGVSRRGSFSLTMSFVSADAKTRIVRCCFCRGMMRVSSRALSVFCPHCQKRISLENLRVVGSHPGKTLATCGDVVVEAGARLNLALTARNVLVHGTVRGPVTADETVEITSSGRVIGDVRAAKIVVRDGAAIEGRCEMVVPQPPAAGPFEDEAMETEDAPATEGPSSGLSPRLPDSSDRPAPPLDPSAMPGPRHRPLRPPPGP